MLPTGQRDTRTAVQVILYTFWTIVISIVPAFGMTGKLYLTPISAVIIGALGLFMMYYAVMLFKKRTTKAAKQLMFASVSYITLLQIIYVLDKFLR